ncbi:ferredoxin [uncultured Selenomonas sp.]|uniref:ferredoxin n=1 Tax=uncultured Selenomonas sp. TaxID=159275 RepID=UPI0025D3BDF9|nr:ferredoxin [uncultured Selenomonas sp.]
MKKLSLDLGKCDGCGICVLDCSLLQETSDGSVEVLAPGIIQTADLSKVEDVVRHCPTGALAVVEAGEGVDLTRLKAEMREPVEVAKPDYDDYAFRLEDKDEYLKELPYLSADGEDEYEYKSSSSARSAGKSAFRNEIYSQAEALIEKILVAYNQRKVSSVARYATVDGNIKYEAHKKLIKRLQSYVNQIEAATGKRLNLPSDFFSFYTKDTDFIERMQDKPNSWAIDRIKENLESADSFYERIRTDDEETYVKVSHWFGDDDYKCVKRYSYSLTRAIEAFKRDVARKTWKYGKYTKQDATREIDAFTRELQKEWEGKIQRLLREID